MTNKEKNIIAHLVSKTKMTRKYLREYAGFNDDDLKPLNDCINAAEKIIDYFPIEKNLTRMETLNEIRNA